MSRTIELEIERMTHGGQAMGHHEGRVIFVPHSLPGERVRAMLVEDHGRYAHARLVEIVEPSPARVAPLCDHAGPGGAGLCQWQHIAYAHQLQYKREIVIDQLERAGSIAGTVVHPTIPAAAEWGYRHHMTFEPAPGGSLGLRSAEGRGVIPVQGCGLMHPSLQELFEQIELDSPVISRVRLQVGSDPEERMVILHTRSDIAPEIEADFPVSANLLLPDNEPVNLIGSAQVHIQVLERAFQVTAGVFWYPNVVMLPALAHEVLDRLALEGSESVLDLYSGVGTLTAFLAERAGLVLSIESYPPAATDAEANTADLENIELLEGPVEAVLADLEESFDAAVVDPPPSGLSSETIDGLAALDVPRIVYISADPASLARDASRLAHHRYRLRDVQPIDMEPQTPFITSIATLVRL